MNFAAWEAERIEGLIWWCGDYECDCIQPQILRISPNREAGYPWVRRETLWEGTFVSIGGTGYPDGVDYETLQAELRAACEKVFGIPEPK